MTNRPDVAAVAPSAAELARRAVHRRAVEAVIWGMPAVNFDLLYQSMVRELGGAFNEVVYWSRPLDWKNQTLTPNADTIYLLPFFSTSDGPMVLEIPPADDGSITGTVMDAWQCPLEDVGPAGVDEGAGGRYLILPPGYDGPIPNDYLPLPSDTTTGYALLRSNITGPTEADIERAVDYGLQVRMYPLTEAGSPPPTTCHDAIDVIYDNVIPYDVRFFQSLDRFVQSEPFLERDKAMIDVLRSVGIGRGKPFAPDPATEQILNEAAAEAHAWLDTRFEELFTPFYDGSQWAIPVSRALVRGLQTFYSQPGEYPVEERGVYFSYAFFMLKRPGVGQSYLMTIRDRDGQPLDGAGNYRLTVPADAPVERYWSITAYDRATHTLIRDQPSASCSSLTPGLHTNPDGSVDIRFGPQVQADQEANWIPTDPDSDFEVLARFFGPTPEFRNKSWRLPDIERIS